jgi:hypothetical protein
MRKAKAKKAGGSTSTSKKDDIALEPATPAQDKDTPDQPQAQPQQPQEQPDQDQPTEQFPAAEDTPTSPSTITATTTTPSLAQQSKARSTSFRQGSVSLSTGGPLSPGASAGLGLFSPEAGETAPDIYRKHVGRIEELERENKTLAKELKDAEKRWARAEEELADLRERGGPLGEGQPADGEAGVEGLVSPPFFPSYLCWWLYGEGKDDADCEMGT